MHAEFLFATMALLSVTAGAAPLPLIPTPVSGELREGAAPMALGAKGLEIGTGAGEFADALYSACEAAGVPAGIVNGAGQLEVYLLAEAAPEAYELEVTEKGARLGLGSEQAVHDVAATLAQLVQGKNLPAFSMKDGPLYTHRGILLDEARSPLGAEAVKKVLRVMAHYKLNRLHWHLTDDQGWRIEIKKYPRLTEIGGTRAESPRPEARYTGDGKPLTAFYTQDEIRDIVAYAKALGITIIPEIEVPGHATAILAAYPEFGNTDVPGYAVPKVSSAWGIHKTVLAPKEETFAFIQDVFDEVCALFPGAQEIYIGGDEVPRTEWEQSPFAQQFMREHGLSKAADIQTYFTDRVSAMMAAKGKKAICWDESLEADHLPDNMVALVWQGDHAAAQAAQRGCRSILCPRMYFYLDYPQGKAPTNGQYDGFPAKGVFSWQKILSYNPQQYDKVLGVQGNCWGEAIQTPAKLEYMMLPRLCAVAEVAWAPYASRPSEEAFRALIEKQYPYFDSEKLNFREEDGTPRRDRGAVKAGTAPDDMEGDDNSESAYQR